MGSWRRHCSASSTRRDGREGITIGAARELDWIAKPACDPVRRQELALFLCHENDDVTALLTSKGQQLLMALGVLGKLRLRSGAEPSKATTSVSFATSIPRTVVIAVSLQDGQRPGASTW